MQIDHIKLEIMSYLTGDNYLQKNYLQKQKANLSNISYNQM